MSVTKFALMWGLVTKWFIILKVVLSQNSMTLKGKFNTRNGVYDMWGWVNKWNQDLLLRNTITNWLECKKLVKFKIVCEKCEIGFC